MRAARARRPLVTMRIGRYVFSPGVWPTVAMIATVAATLWLSNWQWGRAEQKRIAEEQAAAASTQGGVISVGERPLDVTADAYRRARVDATFDADRVVFIDNQSQGGKVGFHVIAPTKLASGRWLLVNRGFVARDQRYPAAPAMPASAAVQSLEGVLVPAKLRYVELGSAVSGNVWQNLDIARYEQMLGGTVEPLLLVAKDATLPLIPIQVQPGLGRDKHLSYAMQWLSFAVLALILWIALNVRKQPSR